MQILQTFQIERSYSTAANRQVNGASNLIRACISGTLFQRSTFLNQVGIAATVLSSYPVTNWANEVLRFRVFDGMMLLSGV
jgi:hypothetical protein